MRHYLCKSKDDCFNGHCLTALLQCAEFFILLKEELSTEDQAIYDYIDGCSFDMYQNETLRIRGYLVGMEFQEMVELFYCTQGLIVIGLRTATGVILNPTYQVLQEDDVAIVLAQTQNDAELAMREVCGEASNGYLPVAENGGTISITERLQRFYDEEEHILALYEKEMVDSIPCEITSGPEDEKNGVLIVGNAQRAYGYITALRKAEGPGESSRNAFSCCGAK